MGNLHNHMMTTYSSSMTVAVDILQAVATTSDRSPNIADLEDGTGK